MCVYLLTRVFGMGGNKACSYERRCIHNGELEECPKSNKRWLHHICQCQLEADYPSVFEKNANGKISPLVVAMLYMCSSAAAMADQRGSGTSAIIKGL